MAETEKKGITVKIDAGLHAQVKAFIEANGMTMAEFVSIALDNELHPKIQTKEKNDMKTIAFQVPVELYNQIKEYLDRHDITQRQLMIDLVQAELDRDLAERQTMTATAESNEEYEEELDEDEESSEETEESEGMEEAEEPEESEDIDEFEDEEISMGM